MIVEIEEDMYLMIVSNIENIIPNRSGTDIFLRRKGIWYPNTGGPMTYWNNKMMPIFQSVLENQFISERREEAINEILCNK